MPKPSPRKIHKSKNLEESPDNHRSGQNSPERSQMNTDQNALQQNTLSDKDNKQRRRINKKILKEIQKHVSDENHQRHLIALIEESLAKPLEFDEIIVRNPSSWIKSLSSNFTWTNRELEWYFAEDRFLFTAMREDECDRWVCIMNWLLARREEADDAN